MKTIKVIDLLNKIANGEEIPKRIMFLGNTYRYDEIDKTYRNTVGNTNIGEMHNLEFYLNEEIEIIEEDKEIKEIKWDCDTSYNDNFDNIIEKINELIIAVNESKKGK